jgi:sigma-B regulation protein RsbU (phosphoserine phosphatase)
LRWKIAAFVPGSHPIDGTGGRGVTDSVSESHLKKIEEENRRLKFAVEELKVLNDIAVVIGSRYSLQEVMDLIVRKCIQHLRAEQAAVVLVQPEGVDEPFRTMIRRADSSQDIMACRLDTQIRGWILKNKMPLLSNDVRSDARFSLPSEEDCPIRSVLSVPLLGKGRTTGILSVFNRSGGRDFTESDQRLLYIIAVQSAQVIENARLAEEEQALIAMREEMRMAYRIQMGLLPSAPPEIQGYSITGTTIPAKEVGGDYYDFIQMSEGQLCVCLGDVSGKGVPAALLMANLQATVRSQCSHGLSPGECLRSSNDLLYKSTDTGRFATLFVGMLDDKRHSLAYANAGQNPPFLVKQGAEPSRLKAKGLILGYMEDLSYGEGLITFEPGEVLLIYSDGVTEAINAGEEEFGEERLSEVLLQNRGSGSERLLDEIISAVRDHTGTTAQADDITVVVIKRE